MPLTDCQLPQCHPECYWPECHPECQLPESHPECQLPESHPECQLPECHHNLHVSNTVFGICKALLRARGDVTQTVCNVNSKIQIQIYRYIIK